MLGVKCQCIAMSEGKGGGGGGGVKGGRKKEEEKREDDEKEREEKMLYWESNPGPDRSKLLLTVELSTYYCCTH